MSGTTGLEHVAVHAENAELLDRLRYKKQVIQNLSNSLDREMKKKQKLNNILRDVNTGDMTAETGISYINSIVGYKR